MVTSEAQKEPRMKEAFSILPLSSNRITPGQVAHICGMASLVPRLLCGGGEKRAWYALFVHAQFPPGILGI